jgi:hypothetical protein
MGDLMEIVGDEAKRNGECRVEWLVIRTLYFPQDDAILRVKEWAKGHGYDASFECGEWSKSSHTVHAVIFRPPKKPSV